MGFRLPSRIFRACGIAGGVLLFSVAATASANTFTPTKTGDPAPNGCKKHDCSLREAVIAADDRKGSDTIVLKSRGPYKLRIAAADPTDPKSGDLEITDPLTITHPGRGLATVDAGGIDRVFDVGPVSATKATFRHLMIRGGSPAANGNGGGVEVQNGATVRIVDSTISGNRAKGEFGGGLSVEESKASLFGSTVAGNSAKFAGGIEASGTGTSLVAVNSTIAGNTARDTGGGLDVFSDAVANLTNVTVVRNHGNADNDSSQDGGGIFADSPTRVRNSIIALNTVGGTGEGADCYGEFISAGVNLLTTNDSTCTGFSFPSNILRSNPKLGALKSNGGRTQTVALLKGSPAIDRAGSGSPKRDQRGRQRDKHPDIGAFEFGAKP